MQEDGERAGWRNAISEFDILMENPDQQATTMARYASAESSHALRSRTGLLRDFIEPLATSEMSDPPE